LVTRAALVERYFHRCIVVHRRADDCGVSVLRQHRNRPDEFESLSLAAPFASRQSQRQACRKAAGQTRPTDRYHSARNTFANFAAASLVGTIGYRLYGETGFAVATLGASIVMFICGDLAPKTFGALHPERLAYPAAWIYVVLDRVLYPLIWCAT